MTLWYSDGSSREETAAQSKLEQRPSPAERDMLIHLALVEFLPRACERQEVTRLTRSVFTASGFIGRRYQQFLETGGT